MLGTTDVQQFRPNCATCKHPRYRHDEEQPYICFDCDCDGFTYYKPSAEEVIRAGRAQMRRIQVECPFPICEEICTLESVFRHVLDAHPTSNVAKLVRQHW